MYLKLCFIFTFLALTKYHVINCFNLVYNYKYLRKLSLSLQDQKIWNCMKKTLLMHTEITKCLAARKSESCFYQLSFFIKNSESWALT